MIVFGSRRVLDPKIIVIIQVTILNDCVRIFQFQVVRNYRTAEFYRLSGKFWKKLTFFSFLCNQNTYRFSRLLIPKLNVSVHLYYDFPNNRGNIKFIGKFQNKFFYFFSVNLLTIKVFEDADSEFHGFGFIRVMIFPTTV